MVGGVLLEEPSSRLRSGASSSSSSSEEGVSGSEGTTLALPLALPFLTLLDGTGVLLAQGQSEKHSKRVDGGTYGLTIRVGWGAGEHALDVEASGDAGLRERGE